MKRRFVCLALACSLQAVIAVSEEIVVADDGRLIQLNDDGTWVQISKDLFATTAAGERVRLQADGLWNRVRVTDQIQSNSQTNSQSTSQTNSQSTSQTNSQSKIVPLATPAASPTEQQVPGPVAIIDEPSLVLGKVEILRRVIRRAKSRHAESAMRFELKVRNTSTTQVSVPGDLAGALVARDSRNNTYAILDVEGVVSEAVVKPGGQTSFSVLVKDAPQWYGIKHLSLEIAAGALGNTSPRLLIKRMDEVVRREVTAF